MSNKTDRKHYRADLTLNGHKIHGYDVRERLSDRGVTNKAVRERAKDYNDGTVPSGGTVTRTLKDSDHKGYKKPNEAIVKALEVILDVKWIANNSPENIYSVQEDSDTDNGDRSEDPNTEYEVRMESLPKRHRIRAIKMIRNATGKGLAEAKKAVDAVDKDNSGVAVMEDQDEAVQFANDLVQEVGAETTVQAVEAGGAVAAEVEGVEQADRDFPADVAYKVARKAAKAHDKSEIDEGFSPRKLATWTAAYDILRDEGYGHNEAVSGGFHLAAIEQSHGESRKSLRSFFSSEFGERPERPDPNKDYVGPYDHPVRGLAEPFIRRGQNVALTGSTGTGKTHMVKAIAEDLGLPVYEVNGDKYLRMEQIVGQKDLDADPEKGGSFTRFMYAQLTKAMGATGEPGVFLLNEISAVPSGVLVGLNEVFQREPIRVAQNGGELVECSPRTRFVVTDNTKGDNEKMDYVDRYSIDESIRDRFVWIEVRNLIGSNKRRALQINREIRKDQKQRMDRATDALPETE